MTFLETARDTDGELLQMEYVAPPRSKGPTEHVHPRQEERYEVLSGALGLRVGAESCTLRKAKERSVRLACPTPSGTAARRRKFASWPSVGPR
jgi:hypothetical protein